MNVRSLHFVCFRNEQVNKSDDRGVIAACLIAGICFFHLLQIAGFHTVEQRVHGVGERAVIAVYDFLDLFLRGDHGLHVPVQHIAQTIQCVHGGGIAHGNSQNVIMDHHGDRVILVYNLRGHGLNDLVRNFVTGQIQRFQPVLLGKHRHEFIPFHIFQFLQRFDNIESAIGV